MGGQGVKLDRDMVGGGWTDGGWGIGYGVVQDRHPPLCITFKPQHQPCHAALCAVSIRCCRCAVCQWCSQMSCVSCSSCAVLFGHVHNMNTLQSPHMLFCLPCRCAVCQWCRLTSCVSC